MVTDLQERNQDKLIAIMKRVLSVYPILSNYWNNFDPPWAHNRIDTDEGLKNAMS